MEQATDKPELTFGQNLVGVGFNPAKDDKVGQVKKMFADLVDIAYTEYTSYPENELRTLIYRNTIGEILNAQMNTVKLLTLKY